MKRVVIKIGSAVLTDNNNIAKERMLKLVSLVALVKQKYDVILVTSGAVAAGYGALKLDKRKQIGKKALAAAGQVGVERALELMRLEIERDMRLMGVSSVSELNKGNIRFR